MVNEKKLTKREKFEMLANIPEVANNSILKEFIEHELELLAKKNSSERGMTPSQKANEELKNSILEEMALQPDRLFSITEMIKDFECCKDLTLPKVTSMVTQLVKAGSVKRLEEKRKAYFQYA